MNIGVKTVWTPNITKIGCSADKIPILKPPKPDIQIQNSPKRLPTIAPKGPITKTVTINVKIPKTNGLKAALATLGI